MDQILDAYDVLIKKLGVDNFFQIGFKNIIFIEDNHIKSQWSSLKESLLNNKTVFIRGYGRDASYTHYYIELYKHLFDNNNIVKDPTNNSEPTKLLSSLTPYSKKDKKNKIKLQNYQISHLFGKTKNPLLFNCSWNLAYIPKFIDPFTGHETQGKYTCSFKEKFDFILKEKFSEYINDYNNFVKENIENKIDRALQETRNKLKIDINTASYKRFEAYAKLELSTI